MKAGIYLITSPSGRRYVGQSINLKRRINGYKAGRCKFQTYLLRSFEKYGAKNHTFTILFECNFADFEREFLKDLLNDLETEFILVYNTFDNPKGMNLRSGGGVNILSKESCKKISIGQKGKKKQPMSAETKLLMSEAKKGIARSAECIAKISATKKAQYVKEKHPMFGTKHGVESRKKMKLARQKRIKVNYETKLIRLKERKDVNEPLNVPKIIGVQKTIF